MTNKPAHSPIGASGMKRWKNCAGSVALSVGLESVSTEFADEGTEAHDLAYKILVARRDKKPEPDRFGYEEEFLDAVDLYVDHIEGLRRPGCVQLFEHRFHLKKLHPLCYGTADGVTYYPDQRLLIVSDLKFGAGVFVETTRNDQLMYYALGAVLTLGWRVKKVRIEIIQPRIHFAEAIRPWEIGIIDLMEFADELVAAALRTEDPNAPLAAGEWCRWCPAAGICPLLRDKAEWLAKRTYKLIDGQNKIDYTELGETLLWLPVLQHWITSTREFAYNEAMKGVKIPGQKLVAKRATRKWKDEKAAVNILAKRTGLPVSELVVVKTSTISPAQIEAVPLRKIKAKVKSKTVLKEFVKDLTVSVSSGYNLVPDKDDRAEAKKVDPKSVFVSRAVEIEELS